MPFMTSDATPTCLRACGQRPLTVITGLCLALVVAGCNKAPEGPAAPAGAASAASLTNGLLIAPEDVLTVQTAPRAQGPVVSGAIQPAKRADLRAEVAAVVVQLLKDNGETVRAGEALLRLDDTAIRDALQSAQESLRVATQGLEQADRNLQRLNTLREQGMVSAQAIEDAQLRRQQALGEQVAAKSRVVTAQQQQSRTTVRAPFDGAVSERRVSVGDTVQVGRELVKVIDPRTMRFEGLVSADRLETLKLGQPVSFRVNGFSERRFNGSLRRIDASVNATTRQVAVWVDFSDPRQAPAVAGLFAEGRIETGTAQVLSVPDSSVQRQGDAGHVWRLQGAQLQKVAVKLGERDNRSGEWPVISGLQAGDRIVRHPNAQWADGQPYRMTAPAAAHLAASAPTAAAMVGGRPASAPQAASR
jgi:membrane fusion protein, multidrug efflux system